ncbi:hypothetical protein LEP1GSC059_4060 [Leptospira noguchii serovar Panama str. CZ214]|uniref:Uncharacterized protein n=1 Tax=Leptospira noguchii serovar Panama str. CZ214 TaxID=1001595 RepID=T0FK75_9LEPT|nr:hypothetical protein LEP1GSC059_4060 [Leptospira noguchii serovar Panama str. CZ214]
MISILLKNKIKRFKDKIRRIYFFESNILILSVALIKTTILEISGIHLHTLSLLLKIDFRVWYFRTSFEDFKKE